MSQKCTGRNRIRIWPDPKLIIASPIRTVIQDYVSADPDPDPKEICTEPEQEALNCTAVQGARYIGIILKELTCPS
jgi:hypothetical protein